MSQNHPHKGLLIFLTSRCLRNCSLENGNHLGGPYILITEHVESDAVPYDFVRPCQVYVPDLEFAAKTSILVRSEMCDSLWRPRHVAGSTTLNIML